MIRSALYGPPPNTVSALVGTFLTVSEKYVCPMNRTVTRCRTCGSVGPHVREELVAKGAQPPECREHGVMVKETR